MKKIISMITCLIILTCMLVVPEPIEVHAEESSDEYTRYYVKALCSYSVNAVNNIRGYYYDVAFSCDKKIAGYLKTDDATLYMCVYDDTGVLSSFTQFLNNLKSYFNFTVESGGVNQFGDYKYEYDGQTFSWISLKSDTVNNIDGKLTWDSEYIEDSGFLNTNIPYFASKEECMAYINGEIDVGSALNFNSDLLQTITDSNEVPAPKNLRIEYDSNTCSYFLMWEYNPEDLKKLNLIAVTGIDKELEVRHLREDYLSWNVDFDVSLDEYLQPQLSYKIDITNDVARLRNAIVDSLSGSIEYRVKLDYWVMGSWNKSSTELHIGKVFHVELLLDSSDKGFVVNTNNYVTDKDMNVLDDLIYDNNLDFDSNFSSSDFLGNITSGFNLLGSNGLIPLLTSTLSFIPSPLWVIIGSGLSLMVIIALFKLIIK